MLATLLATAPMGAHAQPQWVVDPNVPGADSPAAGSSLFDRITTFGSRQSVPYPFERLLESIERAAGCAVAAPCTRTALIPLGRSLQRLTAGPDFFAHPRVVAAVVGEGGGELLRDRLYLGFQERAGVIEVISYNEALGRFEFQIVRDYVADRVPTVTYARRTVCIACHQNHGPIFSQALWLETNANPAIAARLAQSADTFSGIRPVASTDAMQSIDDATDRSNHLALTQRLWSEACGTRAAGAACRRTAALASLQYALTDSRHFERSREFELQVAGPVRANASRLWPEGIAVPSADVPNRDPLNLPRSPVALDAAHVDPATDPLTPRTAREIVGADAALDERLVRGIAEFWPRRQIDELSDALGDAGASVRRVTLSCRMEGRTGQEQFDCAQQDKRLRGSLSSGSGTIEELALPEPVRHLRVEAVRRTADSLSFAIRDRGRPARVASGDAIRRVTLALDRASDADAQATIEIREDFAAVAKAIEQIDPTGPLAASLLEQLNDRIAGRAAASRTEVASAVSVDAYVPTAAHTDRVARLFESQCGSCHHIADTTPPNFLSGDAARVRDALRSCGPRILVRLAMRHVPLAERAKTPMPPEAAVPMPGMARPDLDEKSLVELQANVQAALHSEYGRPVTVDELLSSGYEALRPCLPAHPRETGHG